ncbi:MAG: cupredoxin domain-containing protein [Pseudomonadota bacterium]
MSMLIDAGAVALVAFIVWWFWLYRPRAAVLPSPAGDIEVRVADGVYTPAEITVPAGRETVLRFLRRDRSPCAAMVLIDGLGVSAELPVDVALPVRIRPAQAGRYEFTCQMGMYRGTLVVTDADANGAGT